MFPNLISTSHECHAKGHLACSQGKVVSLPSTFSIIGANRSYDPSSTLTLTSVVIFPKPLHVSHDVVTMLMCLTPFLR